MTDEKPLYIQRPVATEAVEAETLTTGMACPPARCYGKIVERNGRQSCRECYWPLLEAPQPNETRFHDGEYGEGPPWSVLVNVDVSWAVGHGASACRHLKDGKILPTGIRATNQGGFDSTLLCGDCIVDAIAKATV